MIEPKLAVCAESVVRDAETNNVSIFNVIEELKSVGFPVVLPKLSILFLLERSKEDPEQVDVVIQLTLNKKEVGRASMQGDFEGKTRTRIILVAVGVGIEEPGILTTTLVVNGKALAAWDIPVQEETSTHQ